MIKTNSRFVKTEKVNNLGLARFDQYDQIVYMLQWGLQVDQDL